MRGKRIFSFGVVAALVAGILAVTAPPAPVDAVNGAGWSALGSGISSGTVFQIARKPADRSLFVGGSFSSAGGTAGTRYVAQWNPATAPEQWVSVSGGVTTQVGQFDGVYTVAYDSNADRLWIGGKFFTGLTGGGNSERIAMWEANTSAWTRPAALSAVTGGDGVEHLVLVDGKLYIGGDFNRGAGATEGLVVYDGSTLGALDSGLNTVKIVNGMTAAGNGVIVGGQFASVVGVTSAPRLAQWDGTAWVSPTFGGATSGASSGLVAAVATTTNGVFIGGTFPGVANSAVPVANTDKIAFWNSDTSNWESVGSVEGAVVEELSVIGNYLYAGGVFTSIGGVTANNIARYDLTTKRWEAITDFCTNGVNGVVRTIIDAGTGDGSIYVGGAFTQAGGKPNADRIAKYTPGAPSCPSAADLPPLDVPAPGNFRLTGLTPDRFGGLNGMRAHLGWDVPAGSGYRLFVVTTNGRYGPDGFTETPNHSSLSCWTVADSCSIFFPFTSNNRGMAGRQYHEVVYTLQGYSFAGSGLTTSFGPMVEMGGIESKAPRNIETTAGWRSVTVTWDEPEDFGIFDFATNYLVRSNTGQVCITRVREFPSDQNSRTCRLGNLQPGVNYTFQVQALTLAGGGELSGRIGPSTAFDLRITSANRNRPFLWQLLGTRATWTGVAHTYPQGTAITPVVKIGGGPWRPDTSARVRVDQSGKFSYSRDFGREANNSAISVKFEVGNKTECQRQKNPAVPCGETGAAEVSAVRR